MSNNQPKPDLTKRRRARELALQILFQREFVADMDLDASFAYFREQLEIPEESWTYAKELIAGLMKNKEAVDKKITDASRNWKISRMSPVDLNLLRIATFEILYGHDEVPPKVAIDEALEIAKRYSGTESPNFINGLLDEILKSKGLTGGN